MSDMNVRRVAEITIPPPGVDRYRAAVFGLVQDYSSGYQAALWMTKTLVESLAQEIDQFPDQDFDPESLCVTWIDNEPVWGSSSPKLLWEDQEAIDKLETGEPWQDCGSPSSLGGSFLFRMVPVALAYYDEAGPLRRVAEDLVKITNSHPLAIACGKVMATAVAFCLHSNRLTTGPHEAGWWSWLSLQTKNMGHPKLSEAISKIGKGDLKTDHEVMRYVGQTAWLSGLPRATVDEDYPSCVEDLLRTLWALKSRRPLDTDTEPSDIVEGLYRSLLGAAGLEQEEAMKKALPDPNGITEAAEILYETCAKYREGRPLSSK